MGERKLPEALHQLADLVFEALDRADIGMTIVRENEGGLERLYSNRSIARVLGYADEDVQSLPPMVPLAPGERSRLQAMRTDWLSGHAVPSRFETIIVRKDGKHVPVEIAQASTQWQGMPTTVSFVRDQSEYRRIEEALWASETRFRYLAESAPDSIVVIVDGVMAYANRATARILGLPSPADVIGLDLSSLMTGAEVAVMRSRLQRVAQGERLPPFSYHSKRADGTAFLIEISSSFIEWEGKPAFLGYGRDVTERKRMEAELMQADRMATVGTLAAGMAHEINNPLTYVLLHLQRLRRVLPDLVADPARRAETARMLDEAIEGGDRVSAIVRDLLSFSRSSSEHWVPLDVAAIVWSAVKIATTAHADRVQLTVSAPEDLPRVAADEARLGQVFLNVVVNAVQSFGEESPPDARVAITMRHDGDSVQVDITDNGPGISDENLPLIFNPFFTTKPVGTGTGLGLPISRSIVESLGGTLEIENRHDTTGVRVRVRLPAGPARTATPTPVHGTTVHQAEAQAEKCSTVLIVDDEPLVARAVASVLRLRYDARVANSGNIALKMMREQLFDLVLCDINMPDPDGIDVFRTICDEDPNYDSRFVFFTGGAQTERARRFVDDNDHRVTSKPLDMDRLLALVEARIG